MSDEIEVRRLVAARTMAIKSDPQNVVLKLTAAGGDESYFSLPLDDLTGLARQLMADAALMSIKGIGRA